MQLVTTKSTYRIKQGNGSRQFRTQNVVPDVGAISYSLHKNFLVGVFEYNLRVTIRMVRQPHHERAKGFYARES